MAHGSCNGASSAAFCIFAPLFFSPRFASCILCLCCIPLCSYPRFCTVSASINECIMIDCSDREKVKRRERERECVRQRKGSIPINTSIVSVHGKDCVCLVVKDAFAIGTASKWKCAWKKGFTGAHLLHTAPTTTMAHRPVRAHNMCSFDAHLPGWIWFSFASRGFGKCC